MKALILLVLVFLCGCCLDNPDASNRTRTPQPRRERTSEESTVRVICRNPPLYAVLYDGQTYIVSRRGAICKK